MKRTLPIAMLCIAVLWLIIPCANAESEAWEKLEQLMEKQAYVSNWDEVIMINEDASITVIENVTYTFVSGGFGYAYRTIKHIGFDEIKDVSVEDQNGMRVEHSLSGGLFFQDYRVEWKYPFLYVTSNMKPIEKTYTLQYTLTNAMNYQNSDADQDRLYWNIVTDYDLGIENMNIDVFLPSLFEDVSAHSYYSRSATAKPKIVHEEETIICYEQAKVNAKEDYTIDIYFPATVSRTSSLIPTATLLYPILIVPVSIVSFGLIYRRKRNDPDARGVIPSVSELKQALGPSEAGALVNRKIVARHYVAAALSLAERGYITIKAKFSSASHKLDDITFLAKKSVEGLKGYEKYVYQSIAGKAAKKKLLERKYSDNSLKSILREGEYVECNFFSRPNPLLSSSNEFPDKKYGVFIPVFFVLLALALIVFGFYGSSIYLLLGGFATLVPSFSSYLISGDKRRRTAKGARYKEAVELYVENLRKGIERDAEYNPVSAVDKIKDNASWLVLDEEVDPSWMDRIRNKIEERIPKFSVELPSYIKQHAALDRYISNSIQNPITTVSALLIMFEVYREIYHSTSAYYAASVASSHRGRGWFVGWSSGGYGGGGGSGGGGGAGGGGGGVG